MAKDPASGVHGPDWVWWRGMLLTPEGLERVSELTPEQRNVVAERGYDIIKRGVDPDGP